MERFGKAVVLMVVILALLPPMMTSQGASSRSGPSLNVIFPPDGLVTKAATVIVNGTTNGTSVAINGVKATLTGKNFSLTITLTEGTNSLLVQASDAGGNITAKALTVVKDTVPPIIKVTSPHFPLVTNRETVHVEGIVEKGCKVYAQDSHNSAPIVMFPINVTGETFSFDMGKNNWALGWDVLAVDPAGNQRGLHLPVTFDDQLNLTVTTRFDHDYHLNATDSKDLIETYYDRIYIMGKTDPGANVTVDGNPIKVLVNGSFETFVELKLGKNNITINVTDAAGNKVTGYLNVKRYFWEPFVVPVETAGMLLIIGLMVGTGGGYFLGRSKERKVQAQKAAKAAEDARAAQRAQRPPKPRAEMPEKPKTQAPPKPS